jgi:hypothetical protein
LVRATPTGATIAPPAHRAGGAIGIWGRGRETNTGVAGGRVACLHENATPGWGVIRPVAPMNARMNRLKHQPEENEPKLGAGDYFVVSAKCGEWCVSTEMVRFVEAALDADPRPSWVKFVDLSGSRVRIKTDDVVSIRQSTAEQRAATRAFRRSLRQEYKPENPWDEEDDW